MAQLAISVIQESPMRRKSLAYKISLEEKKKKIEIVKHWRVEERQK